MRRERLIYPLERPARAVKLLLELHGVHEYMVVGVANNLDGISPCERDDVLTVLVHDGGKSDRDRLLDGRIVLAPRRQRKTKSDAPRARCPVGRPPELSLGTRLNWRLGRRHDTPLKATPLIGGSVMKAAGIVTTDDSVFREMVAESPSAIQELALASRALIYDVLPETVEVVWLRQRTAGYGTGPKKMSEQFCWLAPYTKHVVFGFYYGTELPDPAGLLEGTGKPMRHVKIRQPEDLENRELRRLVEIATRHRVPPPASRC